MTTTIRQSSDRLAVKIGFHMKRFERYQQLNTRSLIQAFIHTLDNIELCEAILVHTEQLSLDGHAIRCNSHKRGITATIKEPVLSHCLAFAQELLAPETVMKGMPLLQRAVHKNVC